mmetsp:Transcript_4217/g.12132  ORF Transcript_4217/g.12132 Transcript_4217/m.12132 type:complete len:212 (+) Transcript_4217:427-1062(+)
MCPILGIVCQPFGSSVVPGFTTIYFKAKANFGEPCDAFRVQIAWQVLILSLTISKFDKIFAQLGVPADQGLGPLWWILFWMLAITNWNFHMAIYLFEFLKFFKQLIKCVVAQVMFSFRNRNSITRLDAQIGQLCALFFRQRIGFAILRLVQVQPLASEPSLQRMHIVTLFLRDFADFNVRASMFFFIGFQFVQVVLPFRIFIFALCHGSHT